MAIPVIAATGGLTRKAGTNSAVVPTMPTGIVAGDLLVALVWLNGSTELVTPSGWAKIVGKTLGVGTPSTAELSLFWKKAVGSDAAPSFACTGGAAYTSLGADVLRITGAADPSTRPPLLANGSGAATATSYDFNTSSAQTTYFQGIGVLDLIAVGATLTSNVTYTITDPHSIMDDQAIATVDQGNGGVVGFSMAIADGASSHDGTNLYPSAPVHVAHSTTTPYYYAWWGIPGNGPIASIAGSLNNMTAAAAVVIKTTVTVAGSLNHVIAAGAVAITDVAAIAGSLNHITAAGAVEVDDTAITAGLLNNMTAAIVVVIVTTISAAIAGSLNNMTAEISGVVFNDMNIAGLLGNITADAEGTIGDYVAEAGTLGNITGALDVAMGAAAVVGGLLGEIIGSAEIEVHTEVAVAGQLAHVIGMIHIKDRQIKATDPNAIIDMPAASDRGIVMGLTDRTVVIDAVDRAIAMSATDRTFTAGD